MDQVRIESADEFVRRAEMLLAQGMHRPLLDLALERLKSAPEDLQALAFVGHAWLGLDNPDEARRSLERMGGIMLRIARLYRDFGNDCLKRGSNAEALDFFHKSMALVPDLAEAPQWSQHMGELFSTLDGPRAEEEAPQASAAVSRTLTDLEEDSASGFYTLTMAEMYINQGLFELARQVLEEVVRREPGNRKAVERLRDLQGSGAAEAPAALPAEAPAAPAPPEAPPPVAQELSRWLVNLERLRSHGESLPRSVR